MIPLELLEQRLATVERELAELKRQAEPNAGNPWLCLEGMVTDDPMFDEWWAEIEAYRDEQNRAENGQ